jgi:hypothetical protein
LEEFEFASLRGDCFLDAHRVDNRREAHIKDASFGQFLRCREALGLECKPASARGAEREPPVF